MLLGAGRARVDSSIDPAVGVILHKKAGDPAREGEALCTLLVNDESRLGEASTLIAGAYTITDEPVSAAPLIVMRLGA
jgi:thymidine phosphorylase